MRNLKRALSLALASVMLMGMMVVGTSAKGLDDFGDAAEVANQDAVAVTSEIGIFDGYEDGEFKPENVVTRAEMAVIICKMLYGADVRVSQFAETSVFTDVPAWAEGYVNLCASLGIVAGVGNNKFDPNATVTTAQAAMMLTKALGYFQNARDFGDSWVLAATAKATELGLYGDLKLTAAAGLTRDNVAEMVFNTLTKAVPVQYNELLGVYYNENQGIIYSLQFNYLQTLGYKNFDLVYKTNTESMYGRPATTWGFGSYNVNTSAGDTSKTDDLTENGGLIASKVRMLDKDEIITVANVPTYVYTAGTTNKDVYKDLGATVCNEKDYTWTAYVNGVEQDEDDYAPVKNNSDEYLYTGEGTVTEIYIDDADETVVVVEINYYLGQVSKVKEDDDGEYVLVKELSKGAKLDDNAFYTEGYAEDDYVIFTIDENDDEDAVIGEIFAPETVTGEVTRVDKDKTDSTTYLKLTDGSKHTYSESVDADPEQQRHMVYDLAEPNTAKHPTLTEEYTLYLDPAGYVVAYELANEEEIKYLYVKDSDEEMGDWNAKVLLADGTTQKVEVKEKVKNMAVNGDYANDSTVSNKIGWLNDDGDDVDDTATLKKTTNIDGKIFTYTVNSSNVYTLTAVETLWLGGALGDETFNGEIHNGKSYMDNGAHDVIVDRKTVFVDDMNDMAYVGYDEVPNVDDALVAYAKDGRITEVAFILEGDIYDKDATYFVLTGTNHESLKYEDEHYRDYSKAYVNGDKTNVIVNYDALPGALSTGVLYKATKTIDEQYITKVVEIDADYANTVYGVPAEVGDDAFWLTVENDDKDHKFDTDSETQFVLVEKKIAKDGDITWAVSDGNIDDLKVPKNDSKATYELTAQVVEHDDGYADLVYIFLTEKAVGATDTPELSDDIEIINDDAAGNYEAPRFYSENPDVTEMTEDDIFAMLLDAKCSDITINADGTWNFTKPNGLKKANVTIDPVRVYKVNFKTVNDEIHNVSVKSAYLAASETLNVQLSGGGDWMAITITATDAAGNTWTLGTPAAVDGVAGAATVDVTAPADLAADTTVTFGY